jgi:hypothetical protein
MLRGLERRRDGGGKHKFDYHIERLDLRPLYLEFALHRPEP